MFRRSVKLAAAAVADQEPKFAGAGEFKQRTDPLLGRTKGLDRLHSIYAEEARESGHREEGGEKARQGGKDDLLLAWHGGFCGPIHPRNGNGPPPWSRERHDSRFPRKAGSIQKAPAAGVEFKGGQPTSQGRKRPGRMADGCPHLSASPTSRCSRCCFQAPYRAASSSSSCSNLSMSSASGAECTHTRNTQRTASPGPPTPARHNAAGTAGASALDEAVALEIPRDPSVFLPLVRRRRARADLGLCSESAMCLRLARFSLVLRRIGSELRCGVSGSSRRAATTADQH
ncbi:hypothetical protein FN846DRAFT_45255 [Sphaerosporella brunnea]|uniref:Uncharacterized protein n=1 Tax=Sphaerosporella brunnea TaxID=1250544 RepID=A0A5J5EU51_9PEZI|nr:hypothetical protein FN846DRAFT_45255 [Sphaerosporella brunnea]